MTQPPWQRQWRILFWQRIRTLVTILGLTGVVITCAWASGMLDVRLFWRLLGRLDFLIQQTLPPDFSPFSRHWLQPLRDTLIMSVVGTAGGVVLAVPMALLAARGLSPHRLLPAPVRSFLGGLRTIPELLLAIGLVILLGPGMVAGCVALMIHSAGMLGKFYHEIMEHAQPEPLMAVRSCGGNRFQVITHGVIPQVWPQLIDVTLFRWECNIRAAVVLGIIGAGGIGSEIIIAQRVLKYQELSALILIILALVILVDWCSSFLRKRMVAA
ncbi:MAG: phosphonate ABC transporter, permease protein PhnE [Planctomycetota bacterium]|nr:MAG: phosphonate ABC transporter, permease protein PhnE [Planctomycetota bacterium]